MKRFTVTDNLAGLRLDVAVQKRLPDLSRAVIQKISKAGNIKVDGEAEKPGYKLRAGEQVVINYDVTKEAIIPEIELPVLYEDEDCIVINKPIGILTHSKGVFNPEGTVATWLRSKLTGFPEGERAGIVHRLDRATSGVMIVAKKPEALTWLQKQFSQRKVKKIYRAIVEGELEPNEAIIEMPIERNPKLPSTFRVGINGKPAITHYVVLKKNETYSLVELKPQTGRTHQLRVHLAELGHPIVGDTLYNGKLAERLFLHALSLEVTLPNKERKVFTAELPVEFTRAMK